MKHTADATGSGEQEALNKYIILRVFVTLCRILVAVYFVGFATWYALADGLKDRSGTPLGADFINIYAAGVMTNHGQAASVYDWNIHLQAEQAVTHYASAYFGWHYPPLFLAIASLVACAPYLWAFTLYMVTGFAGYWVVLRRLAPPTNAAFWAIAGFPGVFCNIINGQNGFITAALFGAGFLYLEKQPVLAGIFFGLLSYKPQFFVVIPLLLLIGGYRRAFIATTLTALTGIFLSWILFGTQVWQAFFQSTQLTQHIILEQGSTGWQKIQSVFSQVRMWGGSVTTAYALQSVATVLSLAVAAWVWRRKATIPTCAAALCSAMLLTSPYLLDYDLVILSVPIALLARQGIETGFHTHEKTILALLWILPLLARNWGMDHILITPFLLVALLYLCAARTYRTMHIKTA